MGRLIDGDELLRHKTWINGPSGDSKYNVVFCDEIEEAPTVEAIPKADYENRLKADLVIMLKELLEEFEKLDPNPEYNTYYAAINDCSNLTQQKIDKLREDKL